MARSRELGAACRGGLLWEAVLVCATFVTVGAWIQAASLMGTNRETTLPVAASATAASNVSADLDMRSARAASRSGHIVVEGEVRNTAVRRLSGLEVVVEVRTATGTLLTSDAFLVALPNLQPGASTPFRAILVDRREASRCILRFRTQCGDELRVNSCSPGG